MLNVLFNVFSWCKFIQLENWNVFLKNLEIKQKNHKNIFHLFNDYAVIFNSS